MNVNLDKASQNIVNNDGKFANLTPGTSAGTPVTGGVRGLIVASGSSTPPPPASTLVRTISGTEPVMTTAPAPMATRAAGTVATTVTPVAIVPGYVPGGSTPPPAPVPVRTPLPGIVTTVIGAPLTAPILGTTIAPGTPAAAPPASISTVPPISGTTSIAIGTVQPLTDSVSGGTWSSSNPSVATVDGSGNVTGVSVGESTITYSVGTATPATIIVTVYDPNAVNNNYGNGAGYGGGGGYGGDGGDDGSGDGSTTTPLPTYTPPVSSVIFCVIAAAILGAGYMYFK